MGDRRLPDLTNSLEWDLLLRNSYQAVENGDGTYKPIAPITQIISDSFTLMIGVKSSQSLPTWDTGGWAAQRLLTVPSSTSEFTANVQTEKHRLRLGVLNLCHFPKHNSPWLLHLQIPRWLKQATVEIWRYDGKDQNLFERSPLDWQEMTLINWVNNSPPYFNASYANDKGIVRLRGNIRSLSISVTFFTLPEGYRPIAEQVFSVVTKNDEGYLSPGSLIISPNGALTYGGYGYGQFFSLDGVAFEAGDSG